jgi:hypothetical protein
MGAETLALKLVNLESHRVIILWVGDTLNPNTKSSKLYNLTFVME